MALQIATSSADADVQQQRFVQVGGRLRQVPTVVSAKPAMADDAARDVAQRVLFPQHATVVPPAHRGDERRRALRLHRQGREQAAARRHAPALREQPLAGRRRRRARADPHRRTGRRHRHRERELRRRDEVHALRDPGAPGARGRRRPPPAAGGQPRAPQLRRDPLRPRRVGPGGASAGPRREGRGDAGRRGARNGEDHGHRRGRRAARPTRSTSPTGHAATTSPVRRSARGRELGPRGPGDPQPHLEPRLACHHARGRRSHRHHEHRAQPALAAPRLGDWAIQSKLVFSAPPHVNCQQGGIVAYSGDDDYVKLDWEFSGGAARLERDERGQPVGHAGGAGPDHDLDGAGLRDRVDRVAADGKKGSRYSTAYSTNGTDFTPIYTTGAALTNVKVGVFAFNGPGREQRPRCGLRRLPGHQRRAAPPPPLSAQERWTAARSAA